MSLRMERSLGNDRDLEKIIKKVILKSGSENLFHFFLCPF